MSATCVLGRTGTLVGTHSAKRWPVARHNVQCHSQLHKEREADNDRSDRGPAASAREIAGA